MKHIHTISFKVNVKKKTRINIFAINLKMKQPYVMIKLKTHVLEVAALDEQ